MRQVPGDRNDLPPGYELVRFDSRTQLALPTAAARSSREDVQRREDAQEAAQREDRHRRQQELLEQANAEAQAKGAQEGAGTGPRQAVFGDEAAPGWYRVLPKWAELVESAESVASGLRSADKEVNERQLKLRNLLIHKGPDRKLARPAAWRQAIDQLEASLPHFREPVRLLRHSLALAAATRRPVRVPPMLLLGPPGVGKTHFSHRVADLLQAQHASIAFDQPTAGSGLRGSDAYWANSSSGLLFNLICMGDCANPVILLDELDKSSAASSSRDIDPLAQLHGALEPETARRTLDISVGIEFDASQVTYIATANSVRGVGMPILSRLEIFSIEPPEPSDAVEIARAIVAQLLGRLRMQDDLRFDRKGLYVLAHMSPRMMLLTAEKAVAAAVSEGRTVVLESDVWAEVRLGDDGPRLH